MKRGCSAYQLPGILCLTLFGFACAPPQEPDTVVGYVEVEWVYVAAPQSGWLISRPVNAGQEIAIGDTLFELDKVQQQALRTEAIERVNQSNAQARDLATGARPPEIRELQARLEEAEAQLVQARLERERIVTLVNKNLEPKSRGDVAQANFDEAGARVEAAKQSISIARQAGRAASREAAAAAVSAAQAARAVRQWTLDERTITARISGRIEEVFHYPGEYVTAGSPVLAIRPADALKIRFFVSQAQLPSLNLGTTVRAKADGNAQAINATVSYIADSVEFTPPVIYSVDSREKLVFMVEARIAASEHLHPGLPVDVSW